MLKPVGGVALIGQPAAAAGKVGRLQRRALQRWARAADAGGWRIIGENGLWATMERGPLAGAGKWTHQYAEPGNTACGDDEIVKCPLGVLWFGEPGPGKMVERHRKAAAPLSFGGRLFVQGLDVMMAYDAYNGLKLWERSIPGAMRAGVSRECGNLAAKDNGLFVAVNDKCLQLDPATGETKASYGLPPSPDGEPRRWGYVATVDGLLFGSSTKAGRTCDMIFAVDLLTGERRWLHQGKSISHITIAIGDGRVFFADSGVSPGQRQEALRNKAEALGKMDGKARDEAQRRLGAADVRLVVALDAETGRVRWQRGVELTDCRGISRGGGELIAMYRDNALVFCAASVNGHFWRQFFGGDFARRTVVALSGRDGRTMWAKAIGYRHRPLIVDDTLVAEPWAFDLRTGRLKTRKSPLTGEESPWQFARPGHHCGAASACRSTLFFRSYTMAYYDLLGDFGTQHFGAIRPGCWINMIPANGLVLVPESSSGCMCPFPNMCTVVFQPRRENRSWAIYSSFKPGKEHKSWAMQNMAKSVKPSSAPLHHLALNLGAPGDRRDGEGTLWLGYPRPRERLVYQYAMKAGILPGGGYYKLDPAGARIEGTDRPWVHASGCRGLTRCTLPLVGEAQAPGLYTVRLGFIEPDNDGPGQRVFDVKLQGEVVLEGFDVFAEAGARNRAIMREFEGIQIDRELAVEFVPRGAALPVVNSIEVKRTKTLRVSLVPPSFILSDL
ncbi:MAG: outer membrane protein assembly factor BamB family protein, partial [Planctomycetota bacterium]